MNVPALSGLFKAAREPRLCLPHYTVQHFNQLPVPLSQVLKDGEKAADIRAVVLDKDNCFAVPGTNTIHASCTDTFEALRKTYSPENILIVSNSSGLTYKDPDSKKALRLEQNTGVRVLRHAQDKPGCSEEILAALKNSVTSPSQIAVIGDRLFTDIVMANAIGARSIWIQRGIVPDNGILTRFELAVYNLLKSRGS